MFMGALNTDKTKVGGGGGLGLILKTNTFDKEPYKKIPYYVHYI